MLQNSVVYEVGRVKHIYKYDLLPFYYFIVMTGPNDHFLLLFSTAKFINTNSKVAKGVQP